MNIKILLYLVFKKINKRNTLDRTTATFINYFVLNVIKLTKESFKKEDSKLYQTIKEYLDSHSNK